MKLIKPLLYIAVLSIVLVNISYAQKAKLNKKAPAIKLEDSNGNIHTLDDYAGKFIVLEWINYSCPFVKKHYNAKNMQALQKEFTDKDVVWLAICSSAEGKQGNFTKDVINEKSEAHGAAFTAYLLDESGEVGKSYGAKTTPHMYIVNPEGILVYAGGIDDKATTNVDDIDGATNYISKALGEALSEKEISVTSTKPYGCSVKY